REELLAEEADIQDIKEEVQEASEEQTVPEKQEQEVQKTEAEIEAEKAAEMEALNKEKERVEEIEDISVRYKVPYEKTKSAIEDKMSVSDFKRSIKPNNAPTVVRKMTK
ncbi:hypothetical protein OFN23_28510, partial [Escherichia coli]|nr:hypothetical protein [Escherichia coli]